MSYYGGTVTVVGRNLITRLIAGDTIQFTRVVVGAGELPEGKEPIDMEDLVQPIADGTSSTPIVDNGSASMVVEYRNDMNGGLKTGFWLREFGIFAKTDNTDEVLLYYATLGDSPQPVSAYQDNRIDIRRYPISIALEIDAEITVLYDTSAFVTYNDLQQLLNEGVIGISRTDVDIPADGWTQNETELEGYPYHINIPVTGAKSRMTPIVTIYPQYLSSAKDICPTSETIEGAVRLYAKKAPTVDIMASIALIGGSGYIGLGGGGGDVQPASRSTLGGVIIGDGINVDTDGRISVDKDKVMTDEDLVDEDEVMKDVAELLGNEG